MQASFWVKFPTAWSKTPVKCLGYAWGGDGRFLELIGTSHRSCFIPIYDVISPFTPEPPVQIHFPSTRCDVNSFNG